MLALVPVHLSSEVQGIVVSPESFTVISPNVSLSMERNVGKEDQSRAAQETDQLALEKYPGPTEDILSHRNSIYTK